MSQTALVPAEPVSPVSKPQGWSNSPIEPRLGLLERFHERNRMRRDNRRYWWAVYAWNRYGSGYSKELALYKAEQDGTCDFLDPFLAMTCLAFVLPCKAMAFVICTPFKIAGKIYSRVWYGE